MSGEYDRLRNLLLTPESSRLDVLEEKLAETNAHFATVPDLLAEDIERNLEDGQRTRLGDALAEATTGSLELAVRRKPETVVNAVYPVIGPAIRRSIAEALREMSDGFDRSMRETFSPRALRWRLEAWRSGIPYAWVVLRQTTRYQVEHLFLIEPDSGLLLGHVTAKGLPELDADAVAGMFTAINQFVRDSVLVDGGGSGIGSAMVGGYHLAVSEGPHARLVAFVRGNPDQHFGVRLDEINEALHAHHGSELLPDGRNGDHESSFLEQSQLDALNPRDQAVAGQQQSQSRILRIVLGVLVLALLVYAILQVRWHLRSSALRDHLAAEPGLVITGWDDGHRNRLKIAGLMDPQAENAVKTWMAAHATDVGVTWDMRSYASLEPAIIRRRVAGRLGLNEANVEYQQSRGVVRLHGEVAFPQWYAATRPGAVQLDSVQLDASALAYPGKPRIDALIGKIESAAITFGSGTAQPDSGMDQKVTDLMHDIDALIAEGQSRGIAFHLKASGFTDEAGNYEQNRSLRQQRSEWLASRAMKALKSPSTMTIDQSAIYILPGSSVRATSLAVEPFPAKP